MPSDPNQAPLYAPHEPVFPRRVSGKFRTLKWWIMGVTLAIYYLTPFLRWDRGPELPDQAVLVDLAGRRFFFFWIEIWPHEFYFVAGLLIMAGLGLFLFTSALGRVWCGYACPQTVWTDLFILTERWIEGDRNARVRLWNQKWDARKLRLRLTKWVIWALIGLATGGAWVFYFADAPTLLVDLFNGTAHPIAYTTVALLTASTVLLGGFAREQVCIYMCPWPRIQAAMMDEDTLVVAYREWRGEPRGKGKRRAAAPAAERATTSASLVQPAASEPSPGLPEPLSRAATGEPTTGRRAPVLPMPGLPTGVGGAVKPDAPGDCIDCFACVNVCPVGIDIRDGQQLACITCALCIDACDDVMTKIGKPTGLIGYMALKDEAVERKGGKAKPVWKHVLRPRTLLYTGLWSLIGVALVVGLFIRPAIDVTVSPIRNPLFVTLSDGAIRNTYDLRIRNKNPEARSFEIYLGGDSPLAVSVEGRNADLVDVPADQLQIQRVYLVAPAGSEMATTDRSDIRFWIRDTTSGERSYATTVFNGKAQ